MVRYVSHAWEILIDMYASAWMIIALDDVDRMIVYQPAMDGEALTAAYGKDHIQNTLCGLEAVYLTSHPVKMSEATHMAMWVVKMQRSRMCCLPDPKMKVLKSVPQGDGTKVRRAKKRQVPHGLGGGSSKKKLITSVMKDF